MEQIYTTKDIWVMFSVIYGISLIIALIYILYYIDFKKISFIILLFGIIYFSFFIFLNIIVLFDFGINTDKNNKERLQNLLKKIIKFYPNFNLISYIIGLFIFTFWISYLESGYFTKKKKIFRYICTKL